MKETTTEISASICHPEAEQRLVFREHVGSGETKDGERFDLAINAASSPVVDFVDSDTMVAFPWQSLINAAIAARKKEEEEV